MSKEEVSKIADLEAIIADKDRELKVLFRLVNKYKQTITDLEIAAVNREIEIENLKLQIDEHQLKNGEEKSDG